MKIQFATKIRHIHSRPGKKTPPPLFVSVAISWLASHLRAWEFVADPTVWFHDFTQQRQVTAPHQQKGFSYNILLVSHWTVVWIRDSKTQNVNITTPTIRKKAWINSRNDEFGGFSEGTFHLAFFKCPPPSRKIRDFIFIGQNQKSSTCGPWTISDPRENFWDLQKNSRHYLQLCFNNNKTKIMFLNLWKFRCFVAKF